MVVHRGEKKFACQRCKSKFATNSRLVEHIAIVHHGAKPYICKVCEQVFGRKLTLERHIKVIHHPNYVRSAAGVSKVGCKCIDAMTVQLGISSIQHRHYQGDNLLGQEWQVPGKKWKVDGHVSAEEASKIIIPLPFDASDGFVIEFLGHQWHGYPNGKNADKRNQFGLLFGDLYDATTDRLEQIKEITGLPILIIWESRFAEFRKQVVNSVLHYCEVL